MTSLLFSFFSYFSSLLNGSRNVLTDAQKRELFYDSPLNFAEILLSTTTLFRDAHTHLLHIFLFIKKKDSKGGDRGAMCNNSRRESSSSPWLPTPENTRKPTNWATRKKTPKSRKKAIAHHSFNFLRGRSAFGVRRPFGAFSYIFSLKSLHAGGSLCTCLFAEQLSFFLSFLRNVFGKLLFLRPRQATHAPPICCCTFPTASSHGYGASIVMAPRKRGGRRPKTHFPPHTHSRLFRLFGHKNRKSTL